jgi:preprotein translocase subunit SecA
MAMAAAGAGGAEGYAEEEEFHALPPVVEQRRVDETEQIGRNDPCWCGSGKKFKKCHGA